MAHGSLKFGLLGAFEVTREGQTLALGGRRQRAILAMLACEAGHAVSVERLVDGVWGDPAPPGVVTSVQSYVFHLRQVLEPDRPRGTPGTVLVTVPGGYRLEVDPRRVDVARFEDLVAAADAAAERHEPGTAAAAYRAALALWRGDVLEDLGDHDFVAPVRARLDELHASALESRIRAELELGHHSAVVAELGSLVAQHPLREGLHAELMLALYRSRRQSDALAAYRDLRSVLDIELGIEPSPPLQELNTKMLRQDPTLDWVAAAPAPVTIPALAPAGVSNRLAPAAARRTRLGALTVVAVAVAGLAGGATLPLAEAPVAAAAVPANAVSELDENGHVVASVPVGTNPTAVVAGGGAIWVLSAGDGTVQRINPSTHAVAQTITVGHDPRGLAITGDDLWVTNSADRTVTRINLETNEPVDEIDVGTRPDAIAAGPAGLWVANSGDNTIQQIDIGTGVPGPPVYVDDGPDGLAVDEDSVWVAHGRSGTVLQIDADTRQRTSSSIPVGSGPRGIVRSGEDVWVANELSASVARIDVDSRRVHPVDVGDGPTDLAVLGDDVWAAEKYSGSLLRIDRESFDVERFDLGAPVTGVAVAEGRIWVVSGAFASTSHLGGELRIALTPNVVDPEFWAAFDPTRAYDIWSTQAGRIVYDGLVGLQYSGADAQVMVPDLADAVPTPTDGGRTYIFNLRPGIRYSTGEEVRASDFVRGVQRALYWRSIKDQAARPDFYAGIVGGQACIDDRTTCDLSAGVVADDAAGRVTFHLEAPDPLFLYKLTLFVVPTPPGTPVGKLDSPPPGTGPYLIAPSDEGTVLTLTRNPWFRQWSLPAQPRGFPDTITWRTVPSAAEAVQAVEHGRADLTDVTATGEMELGAMRQLVERLRITVPGRLHDSPVLGTNFLALDSSRPPFDNLQARRALNFALDRTKMIELSEGPSLADLTCQLMPPRMPSYRSYCPYTSGPQDGTYRGPDLDRARALVRASGSAGTEVEVGAIIGRDRFERYVARVLRSLGYRASVRRFPDSDAGYAQLGDPASSIEVVNTGWVADYPAPSTMYDITACYKGDQPILPGYCDPEMDRRAAAAASMLQSEPGQALRAWTEIDQDVTDQAPFVAWETNIRVWMTSERVGNYQNGDIIPGPLLSQVWVN